MKPCIFIVLLLIPKFYLFAHPMPSSVVTLSVLENSISGEAKMPLLDLEGALKMDPNNDLDINTTFFKDYFHQHIKAYSGQELWATAIDSISTTSDVDVNVGYYREAIVWFKITPPKGKSPRNFLFYYDAIVHQIVTHSILVYLKNDWKNGLHIENVGRPLGVIATNFKVGKFEPLTISLEEGSWWKGFRSMMDLGMQHIKEGTDHLMFLIVLLLPATLLVKDRRWGGYAGTKYSLSRLLKIVTAFTIGHSVTLLIGALGWIRPPAQAVEVLIAVSILVSSIHALRPIFPGKEFLVAGGFGLVHGLAFSSALFGMGLGARSLALSILGFNLGIELMQLFIIAIIVPWLLLLSQTPVYGKFRATGAVAAISVSLGWIAERCLGTSNFITEFIKTFYSCQYAIGGLAVLTVVALFCYWFYKKDNSGLLMEKS